MIKINLLPQEMVGGRGGGKAGASAGAGGSQALIILLLLVVFAADAALAGWMYISYENKKQEHARIQRESNEVKERLATTEIAYNDARANFERLERLVRIAEELDPADRFLWSKKLNMMPKVIPEGVYLTELAVTERIVERETKESLAARNAWAEKREGTPPPVVKVPTFTQTLDLKGVSFVADGTPGQRLEQIVRFQQALMTERVSLPFNPEEENRFIDGFVPRIIPSGPVTAGEVGGRDVSRFTFRIVSEPFKIADS